MSNEAIAELLRLNEPLVIIEASAGYGKTAAYAKDFVSPIGSRRLLLLTHTQAACAV